MSIEESFKSFADSLGDYLRNPESTKDFRAKVNFDAEIHISGQNGHTRTRSASHDSDDNDFIRSRRNGVGKKSSNNIKEWVTHNFTYSRIATVALLVLACLCLYWFAIGVKTKNSWSWTGWGAVALLIFAFIGHVQNNVQRAKEDEAAAEHDEDAEQTTVAFYNRFTIRVTTALLLAWIVAKYLF